jgi:hypothetical protein
MPICPVINWKQAPAYKLAQHLTHILTTYIPLPNAFIIKNSMHLINDLTHVPYNSYLRLTSPDINNMYANIPTNELTPPITALCNWYNIGKKTEQAIIKLTQVILKQNCFQLNDNIYTQTKRLAMGAPTSSVLSEIYLQYLEHTTTFDVQNLWMISFLYTTPDTPI